MVEDESAYRIELSNSKASHVNYSSFANNSAKQFIFDHLNEIHFVDHCEIINNNGSLFFLANFDIQKASLTLTNLTFTGNTAKIFFNCAFTDSIIGRSLLIKEDNNYNKSDYDGPGYDIQQVQSLDISISVYQCPITYDTNNNRLKPYLCLSQRILFAANAIFLKMLY